MLSKRITPHFQDNITTHSIRLTKQSTFHKVFKPKVMFNFYQETFSQHHLSVVETFRLLISHNSNIVWLHPFYEAYITEISSIFA